MSKLQIINTVSCGMDVQTFITMPEIEVGLHSFVFKIVSNCIEMLTYKMFIYTRR